MKSFFFKLKDKYGGGILFFGIILFIYLLIGLYNFNFFLDVGKDFLNIFINQILLVLVIIFIFMFGLNILLEKDIIKNKIKNSKNSTKYIVSIIGGILSTGPVYMWYPFLKQLNEHGLNYGHIATFIYARSVKIQFFAVMILYFGLKYTIIFNLVLIFLSFVIGILVNSIFNGKIKKNNSNNGLPHKSRV